MECFKLAADLDPGNWQPVYYQAVVYRRMGEWNKSQALLSRVLKYNPSDALVLTNIGSSYFYLRDYDSSIIFHNRAVDIMPTWSAPYVNKISALFLREGSTMEARIVLDTLIRRTGKKFQKLEITMDIYDSKFNDALIKTELSEPSAFDDPGDKLLHFASIHEYLDHTDLSGIYYDSALVYYTKALKDFPESADNHIGIGKAYAGLKEFKKAIDAGKRAVELSNDAVSKNDMLIGLAEIYIRCRDFRNAIVLVDNLLNQPSRLSINSLLLDPVWRPLRKEKEFAKLLSNYSVK
jgi:tetratricopeptide (TPR) repeat protein